MNRQKNMIRDYLEIIPGNYSVQPIERNRFRIKDLIDNSTFTLSIRNGRIYLHGQDCVENMKSAYDYDAEILLRIREFEKRYYGKESLL